MELLDVKELAALLRLSCRQIWKLNAAGRIPAPVRIARSVRWEKRQIEAWVRAGCPDLTGAGRRPASGDAP